MRWLLTGANGQLGGYLLRDLVAQGEKIVAWTGSRSGSLFGVDLQPVDLADRDAVEFAFRQARPDVVIHAAAMARIADCYRVPERARLVNTQGSALLADLATETGCRLLHISTDLVFDGQRGGYREEDPPSPISVYGRTKADAERAVLTAPRSLVARVSLLFGPSVVGRPSFFDEQIAALRTGKPITLFMDEWRTPLSLHAAATALIALARSDLTGLLHLGGPERMTRLEMGQRIALFYGLDPAPIQHVCREQVPAQEPRPRDTSLDSSRWRARFPSQTWPTFSEALHQLAVLSPSAHSS